jgi:hypothetical protein
VKWVKSIVFWLVILICLTLFFQATHPEQSNGARLAERLIGVVGLIGALLWLAIAQKKSRTEKR